MSDIYSSRQAGSRQMSSRPMSSERSAFTLVELMVVIGIIGLLVAIALPAFNQARISVRKATSKATITAISTGLEQLRADEKFGGTYPPSYAIGVENPYGGTPLDVCGASLAVWGTVGTDMLGTAGFRDPDNCGASWQVHFADLYKVNGSTPVYPRNSFVDVSKVKVTQRVANGNFEIPTKPKQYLNAPAFLDAFDQPILYYRANLGQPQMVCNVSTNDGIYSITDNEMIARPGAGLDFGAGTTHFSKGLG
ncbi:MAG: prepilin-type N-terminal cleavage/methylation domain-containing protein, partial [Phycisphaerae bacterium]|nr:prepilin-type N-terminal cleavage/methylation domain-containing protein [Phycisphaerae bacterium]